MCVADGRIERQREIDIGSSRAGAGKRFRRELDSPAEAVVGFHHGFDAIGRRHYHHAVGRKQSTEVVEIAAGRVGEQHRARLVIDQGPQERLAIGERLEQNGHRLGFEPERIERRQVRPRLPHLLPARQNECFLRREDDLGVNLLDQLRRGELRQVRRKKSCDHQALITVRSPSGPGPTRVRLRLCAGQPA